MRLFRLGIRLIFTPPSLLFFQFSSFSLADFLLHIFSILPHNVGSCFRLSSTISFFFSMCATRFACQSLLAIYFRMIFFVFLDVRSGSFFIPNFLVLCWWGFSNSRVCGRWRHSSFPQSAIFMAVSVLVCVCVCMCPTTEINFNLKKSEHTLNRFPSGYFYDYYLRCICLNALRKWK
jgi:hypothetical protein